MSPLNITVLATINRMMHCDVQALLGSDKIKLTTMKAQGNTMALTVCSGMEKDWLGRQAEKCWLVRSSALSYDLTSPSTLHLAYTTTTTFMLHKRTSL